jgi:hypothetical protein
MKTMMITLFSVLLLSQGAVAQSLAPATSDDLNDFDRQLSEVQSSARETSKGSKSQNFGSAVSEEAKTLKDNEGAQKGKMGKWVREQKGKSDESSSGGSQKKSTSDSDSDDRDARKAKDRAGKKIK